MFNRIELHNFESFSDLDFNLDRVKDEPRRMLMVYGENGAGKTNLIESVLFLQSSAHTYRSREPEIDESSSQIPFPVSEKVGKAIVDLLRIMNESIPKELRLPSLPRNAVSTMTNGADGMSLRYAFQVAGRRTEYAMSFDSKGVLVHESLSTVVTTRFTRLFEVSRDSDGIKAWLSPSFIKDAGYSREVGDIIARYWGNNTLFSIMNDQYDTKNGDFMSGRVDASFDAIRRYIDSVVVFLGSNIPSSSDYPNYWDNWIDASEEPDLVPIEAAYDDFFTSIDGNTAGVHYERREDGGRLHYYLVFDRRVGGRLCSIPFEKESSGIRKLAMILPAIVAAAQGSVVFIDEMDSGIHDVMMSELIHSVCGSIKGQLVFTTHNTELLEDSDSGTAYSIGIDSGGYKSIAPFKTSARIQKNNSLRRQYLKGTFKGIPYVGYIDMDALAERMPPIGEGRRWHRRSSSSPTGSPRSSCSRT